MKKSSATLKFGTPEIRVPLETPKDSKRLMKKSPTKPVQKVKSEPIKPPKPGKAKIAPGSAIKKKSKKK